MPLIDTLLLIDTLPLIETLPLIDQTPEPTPARTHARAAA